MRKYIHEKTNIHYLFLGIAIGYILSIYMGHYEFLQLTEDEYNEAYDTGYEFGTKITIQDLDRWMNSHFPGIVQDAIEQDTTNQIQTN